MTLAAKPEKISDGGENVFDWKPNQVPMIRYKGIFDWQGLYRLIRLWIENNNYKFNETKYKHKGSEVEVNMIGERKIDEMQKYDVFVHIHIWNLKNIDVVQGTKTLKRNEAQVHIEIHGVLKLDWTGRFAEGGKFNQMIYRWWKVIRKNEITSKYLEPLSMDLYKLHTDIKTFMDMTTDANYYGN